MGLRICSTAKNTWLLLKKYEFVSKHSYDVLQLYLPPVPGYPELSGFWGQQTSIQCINIHTGKQPRTQIKQNIKRKLVNKQKLHLACPEDDTHT